MSCNFINCQLESHFWHHVVKGETLRKQKWTPHLFNTPHAGAIYNNFKVYHIIRSEKERRAGHELRTNVTFKKTTYVQGQIYKHFVKSNGNIVLIILETFFEVRPVNHLKQFIVENEGSFFLQWNVLDLRIGNKIKSCSLQVSCNSADWKKEALKNIKVRTGFKPVPPRY